LKVTSLNAVKKKLKKCSLDYLFIFADFFLL